MSELQSIHQRELDNGLKVIIKPMGGAPVVSVWVWYGVGSRFERPGITGVSHWAEHMLFKGTPTFGKGEIMKSVNRVGGMNNGFTSTDYTAYFETLPADHYDLGLRIEADRMVNSTFDPDEVASERSVIISEREGSENEPQAKLWEEVQGLAYQVHPYRWSVVGCKCDLEKITRDDLYAHYRRFYGPDNATLVLTGALDPGDALEEVRRRFGDIERVGLDFELRSREPEQHGERRVELHRPGNAVYWQCVYHIPEYAHPDRLPLMVFEAVLSGARPLSLGGGASLGRSARLHDVLVNRKKVAVWAGGYARFMADPGLFALVMMLRDGVKPARAERAMFAEIDRLQQRGPTASELKTALRQVQAQVEYARDGVTANAYMIGRLSANNSLSDLDMLVDGIAAVTAEDVVRVARAYLTRDNRTVGTFIPEPGSAGGSSAAGVAAAFREERWMYQPVPVDAAGSAVSAAETDLPTIREATLPSGVRVLGIESPESHCVAIAGFVRGGAALDAPGLEGTACLAGRMLDQGTSKMTVRQISRRLDGLGAGVWFGAGADSTDFGGKCLRRDLGRVLGVLNDCLSDMAAPEDELEKVRGQVLTGMKADHDSTRWMASRAATEALYPAGHPYHSDSRGTPETVAAVTREDLLAHASRNFVASNLTIALVGPLAFDRMCDAVAKAFGGFNAGTPAEARGPSVLTAACAPGEHLVEMADKSQCDLVVVRPAVPCPHADHHGLEVASCIFGQFGLMGRIGERVRDQMGLAYYAYAGLDARLLAGHWAIRAGVNPANVRKALAAIEEETRRFWEELVSDQELSDSAGGLTGSQVLRMETSDSLARMVREIAFHNLPLDYPARYREDVRAVTREKVRELAQRYLAEREPVIAIAGPPLPG